MRLVRAFLTRDFRVLRSYRLAFLVQLAGFLVIVPSLAFLARLVPGNQASLQPYGGDYFTFVLIGSGVLTFFTVALTSFADTFGLEQTTGTLEALLVTPNDPRVLLVGGALYPFIFSAVELALFLVAGVAVFGARIAPGNLLLVCGALLLSLLAFSALGLLAAALLIQTKRAALVVGMAAGLFGILGGVMYPVSVLPGWLSGLAQLLPITYGIDAIRLSLLPSPDLGRIGKDLLTLGAFAAVLLPAALLLFGWSVDRARRQGSIGHY